MALNEQQKNAVEADGAELLISASAGTGKTSTMCRRIYERIMRDKDPLSLDRMLIVTFTIASAADMRRKMSEVLKKALRDASLSKEKKERLRQQLKLLPSARICTIDSYCYDLVRSRFDTLGISPRMRIPDDAEIYRIRTQAMSAAMEKLGADPSNKAFTALIDGVLDSYVDRDLNDIFIDLYNSIDATVKGVCALKEIAKKIGESADLPFEESEAGRFIVERLRDALTFFAEEYRRYAEVISQKIAAWDACEPVGGKKTVYTAWKKKHEQYEKLANILSDERSQIERALELAHDPAAMLEAERDFTFEKMRAVDNDEDHKRFKFVRDMAKDFLRVGDKSAMELRNFAMGQDRASTLKSERELTDALYALLLEYKKNLEEQKNNAGLVEFSDIERYAMRLLIGEDGAKTPLAQTLSLDFDEIYVDEYQDVNEIQDSIFKALSRNNRYMVGDIKQSIYGFRYARPEIFQEMRTHYPPVSMGGPTGSIYFGVNYRCSRQIIAFVNRVCSKLLDRCVDMDYDPADDLIPQENAQSDIRPQICLVGGQCDLFDEDVENAEAAYTARCVKAMIQNGEKPENIAVLVSKMTLAPPLRRAFDREGVALNVNCRKNFFRQPEVLLLRCLVEMINNPTKDIYLAGAMRSPVFGFTLDDLLRIRRAHKNPTLYGALIDCQKRGEEPELAARVNELLRFLGDFRQRGKEWTADKLVYEVMSATRLLPLLTYGVTPGRAAQIKDNVLYFYDLVRTLSAGGAGQIGRVLSRIADMEERDMAGDGKSATPVKGRVQLMTVHGSKGLEFKICWLYGCASSRVSKGSVLRYSENFGAGLRVPDSAHPLWRRRSEFAEANAYSDSEKQISERFRLLYVALTRAESRLYISGSLGKIKKMPGDGAARKQTDKEVLLENLRRLDGDRNFPVRKCGDFLSMIFFGVGEAKDLFDLHINEYPEGVTVARETAPETAEQDAVDAVLVAEKKAEYERRLNFRYPHAEATVLPSKKAVSKLYPGMLDEESDETNAGIYEGTARDPHGEKSFAFRGGKAPRFVLEDEGKDSVTAAERGTATHTFMQFCDFAALEKDGADKEGARLKEAGFIDETTLERVDRERVEAFVKSAFFGRLKDAMARGTLRREQRFMLDLPASEFTSDPEKAKELKDEKLLVQGVIDGFFEEKDGRIVLFDYKTDHFSPQAMRIPGFCEGELKKRHTRQLGYYARALADMLGRPVDECYVYSFALDREIPVDPSAAPSAGEQDDAETT